VTEASKATGSVVCLLTGASRGIGRATALLLAKRGVELILLGRPSEALCDTAKSIKRVGGEVWLHRADLAKSEEVTSAMDAIIAQHGTPSIVINNAGVIHRELVESTTDGMWEAQLAVNLRAPFLITRAVLPLMKQAKKGRLLYIGSIASTLGTARSAAYCAAKWGLLGFVKSVAEELRDTGMMAMALLPGSVDTEMLVGSGFAPRITPEEVAQSLVYFALEAPLSHNGAAVEMFGV
jgi:3-oxoacyl-[acyl-carrier protein] reductase